MKTRILLKAYSATSLSIFIVQDAEYMYRASNILPYIITLYTLCLSLSNMLSTYFSKQCVDNKTIVKWNVIQLIIGVVENIFMFLSLIGNYIIPWMIISVIHSYTVSMVDYYVLCDIQKDQDFWLYKKLEMRYTNIMTIVGSLVSSIIFFVEFVDSIFIIFCCYTVVHFVVIYYELQYNKIMMMDI